MQMTIEDSIENIVLLKKIEDYLGNISGNTNSVASQSFGCAIDTMRKYQKIEEIMHKVYTSDNADVCLVQRLAEIREVMEDGSE